MKNTNVWYYFFIKRLKKLAALAGFFVVIFLVFKYYPIIYANIRDFYLDKISIVNKNICNKVVINGIKYSDYAFIQESINDYCSSQDMSLEQLKETILKDYWIKDIYIQRIYPNSLRINIVEYNPFAIYTEDNVNYNLIDEYGNNINIPEENISDFSYLLIISGENVKDYINDLFNLLSIYYDLSNKIYMVDRVGGRRWNLMLKNNILIKMPEEDGNIFNVWSNLDKMMNIYGLDVDLEEIDLRIKDRIYLKYKDKTFKEIENLNKIPE